MSNLLSWFKLAVIYIHPYVSKAAASLQLKLISISEQLKGKLNNLKKKLSVMRRALCGEDVIYRFISLQHQQKVTKSMVF